MKRFGNLQTLLAGLAVLGLSLATARPAAAQLNTGFEPSDGYTVGSNVDGTTDANSGNTWYLPNGPSMDDHFVVDDGSGSYNPLPPNPNIDVNGNPNTQFISATNVGDGNFNRAQLDFAWGNSNTWTISYDMVVSHVAGMKAKDNISSFSLQPSDGSAAYFIQLNIWRGAALTDSGNGRWIANLEFFDASGNMFILRYHGKPFKNIPQNKWVNISMTVDFGLGQVTSLTVTHIGGNGKGATILFGQNGNPTIYLAGAGSLPPPSALRYFCGGGSGLTAGNIIGFDNLSLTPGQSPRAQGELITVDAIPVPKSVANGATN